MHFLRSVEKEKLVETFREGFAANSPQKAAARRPGSTGCSPRSPT
jgi:hypothetical protein